MDSLIQNLQSIVGKDSVLSEPDELLVYECDGLPHHKHRPRAVVFPSSTEDTAAVMRELARQQVAFTPRGAGTGLSGGALALNQGVVVEMARMRKILKIDVPNRLAIVQPGVINLQVSAAAAPHGLYYVPDPSSQPTCTIGGNIAESAGGIHCLKYGTTTDHVLACKVVLAGGEIVDLGNATGQADGYDLIGTFIGSEGTFGIATEATLRLVQTPPAVRTLLAEFGEVNDASHAVSAIIAAGVMPAALEMMDREIIRAVEASVFAAGLPPDAGAALLIELDGIESGIDDEAARVTSICLEYGARSCRLARDEHERKKLWAARKGAFGAIGRISPDSMIQDAVVPRSRLPEVLDAAYQIADKYRLRIANVFHAGDGNLHPLICFDSRFPDEVMRVKEAGRELMQVCVNAGGTITGEHGVGLDKREFLPYVFSEDDMDAMLRVRTAFDPNGLCNPGKIIPMLRGCGEGRAVETSTTSVSTEESNGNVRRTTAASVIRNKTPFAVGSAFSDVAGIVGEDNCATEPDSIVVAPANVDEISAILKLTAGKGWTVLPAGGFTWTRELYPSHNGIIIKTTRLNRIIEHEPADLIAIAEAGVRLTDFNRALSENGQWLPLDPPDDGRATLGGVVAAGLGGAQQMAFGRPRGSVIGMKVVLADGNVIKAGGRVVKNVAGYDLCKLFTGSYGTLGVITEINFKLRPVPERQATVIATGDAPTLITAAQSIMQARLFPVALELLSPAFARELEIATEQCVLLVRFAGNKKAVTFQTDEALKLLAENREEIIEDDDAMWRRLASIPLSEEMSSAWRAAVLPAELPVFVQGLGNAVAWQAGVGDGRVRALYRAALTTEQIKYIRNAATRCGGVFTVEKGRGDSSPQQLGERIKQQLDPSNVFPSIK
ncbi:MAG TPA: FAD-linked oxidase C-terminal domain-containing protein [Pyrinomonadaceae bacterium]|nr:FAD-linked oxidase C-terminal domain-containing protein [Pyrinomonadaceae bacterium]